MVHEADGGPWDEDLGLYPESQREPQKDLEQKRDTIRGGLQKPHWWLGREKSGDRVKADKLGGSKVMVEAWLQ